MGLEHIRSISLLRDRGSTIVGGGLRSARKEARAELDKWGFQPPK